MDDSVRDELAFGSELNPLNPRGSTFRTDLSWWNHDVLAAHASYSHQFAVRALPIELFDSWRRQFAQFSGTPQDVNHSSGA